eukprot:TRINITY_DN4317_c0_g4_i1.p1 TRINITY_DN4317_c0_g4~~TRINITY_DN4317_c0_g4_i1.p1  ORF type:complete len:298 (-),score=44.55 TRINITY_DN4317_c0_g4_i1:33-926(-)
MLMTVLIQDAKSNLTASGRTLSTTVAVHELLYADDTLLIDSEPETIEFYMQHVASAGHTYGLSFNWKKLELLAIGCDPHLATPDGSWVKRRETMVYLGSLLASDAGSGSELNRRIGAAKADFEKLQRVWSHANIGTARKLRIFDACVVSKLMYNLHAIWLNAAEQKHLDAFQNKCLRRVLRIQPSFLSRISNKAVLAQASRHRLSSVLLQRQLILMGDIAARVDADIMRRCIFVPGTMQLLQPQGLRRRGRPRVQWAAAVYKHAVQAAGSQEALDALWQATAKADWRGRVLQYCGTA